MQKNVQRQIKSGADVPVKYLKALTHNVFEYSDPSNFRRETLIGIIKAAQEICAEQGSDFIPATGAENAAAYRQHVPRPTRGEPLSLDTRGRGYLKRSKD